MAYEKCFRRFWRRHRGQKIGHDRNRLISAAIFLMESHFRGFFSHVELASQFHPIPIVCFCQDTIKISSCTFPGVLLMLPCRVISRRLGSYTAAENKRHQLTEDVFLVSCRSQSLAHEIRLSRLPLLSCLTAFPWLSNVRRKALWSIHRVISSFPVFGHSVFSNFCLLNVIGEQARIICHVSRPHSHKTMIHLRNHPLIWGNFGSSIFFWDRRSL